MKALVYKEFINVKFQYLAIWGIFIIINFFLMSNTYIIPFMIVLSSVILLFTSFTMDEKVNFDYFILPAPVSKLHIVMAKYMIVLIMTFSNMIISSILLVLLGNAQNMLEVQCFSLSIVLILCSIVIPLLFRFGLEKARLIFMATYFCFMGIVIYISNHSSSRDTNPIINSLNFLGSISPLNLAMGMLVFGIILFGISIFLSHFFYKKREF